VSFQPYVNISPPHFSVCNSCGKELDESGLFILVATSQDKVPEWWCWTCVVPTKSELDTDA